MKLFPAYAEAGRSFHGSRRHVGAIRTTKTRGKGIPQPFGVALSNSSQLEALGISPVGLAVGARMSSIPTEIQLCVRVMAAKVCAICRLGMNMALGRVGARHAVPLRCNCRPAPQSSGRASSLVPYEGSVATKPAGIPVKRRRAPAGPHRDSSLTLGRHSSTIILRRICILLAHSRARTTPWHKYRNRKLPKS